MSEQNGKADRRTLLKILGSAGATSAFFSACGRSITTANAESHANVTGGKWDKAVSLATAGPGGNPGWQPGDAVKFLPPEKIATRGRAADVLASLPKEKLLTSYQRMNASRKWER